MTWGRTELWMWSFESCSVRSHLRATTPRGQLVRTERARCRPGDEDASKTPDDHRPHHPRTHKFAARGLSRSSDRGIAASTLKIMNTSRTLPQARDTMLERSSPRSALP